MKFISARSRSSRAFLALGLSTALSAALITMPTGGTFVRTAQADPVYVKGIQIPSFSTLVQSVKPAVVSVQVKSNKSNESRNLGDFFGNIPGFDQLPDDHPMKRFFRNFQDQHNFGFRDKGEKQRERVVAQGSGFFYSDDGYIVTNNHVVDNGDKYAVTLEDGTQLDAKLIGIDSRTDLAVLKVDAKDRKFTYVSFANDKNTHIGDWVLAAGNPFGLGGTVTAGIVSARGRDIGAGVYDDFLQIDAAVNQGNSGGPTFNLNGQVVGINTAIFSPSGGSVGIAFAIPSSSAENVVKQLIAHGTVERGWLGVQIQPVTQEVADSLGLKKAQGALIANPLDGPAAKAGVKTGDIITSVNGEEIKDARGLARKIATITPGDTAKLTVWRNGKQQNIDVKVTAQPKNQDDVVAQADKNKADTIERYGLRVAPIDDGSGVLITDMDRDSEAAEKGVRPGDIIRSVNNQEISSPKDLQNSLSAAAKRGSPAVLLHIEKKGMSRFITLSVQSEK